MHVRSVGWDSSVCRCIVSEFRSYYVISARREVTCRLQEKPHPERWTVCSRSKCAPLQNYEGLADIDQQRIYKNDQKSSFVTCKQELQLLVHHTFVSAHGVVPSSQNRRLPSQPPTLALPLWRQLIDQASSRVVVPNPPKRDHSDGHRHRDNPQQPEALRHPHVERRIFIRLHTTVDQMYRTP